MASLEHWAVETWNICNCGPLLNLRQHTLLCLTGRVIGTWLPGVSWALERSHDARN